MVHVLLLAVPHWAQSGARLVELREVLVRLWHGQAKQFVEVCDQDSDSHRLLGYGLFGPIASNASSSEFRRGINCRDHEGSPILLFFANINSFANCTIITITGIFAYQIRCYNNDCSCR